MALVVFPSSIPLEFVANRHLCASGGEELVELGVAVRTTNAVTNTEVGINTPVGVEFEVVTVAYAQSSNLSVLVVTLNYIENFATPAVACNLTESTEVVTIECFAEVVTTLSNCAPTVEVKTGATAVDVFPRREDGCHTREVNGPLRSHRELSCEVEATDAKSQCVRFESANLSIRYGYSRYKRENQKCNFFSLS